MSNAIIGALRVVLGMDSAAFESGARKAESRMGYFQKKMLSVGRGMQSAGQRLTVGVTAPLVALAYKAVAAAGVQEKAVASVDAALRSMGEGAGFGLSQLEAMASKLQDGSLFGDEEILSKVTANLLTFGNVQGDVFERAQQMAVDLSARLGTDLQSSAVMLGKALNDPIAGLSALSRVGVSFTAQQKEQIKAMAQAGDVAGAQALMLAELEKQYAGQAAALAGTDSGRITQAWNAIGDALEKIGAIILPILADFAGYAKTLAEKFQQLSPETQRFVVIAGALAAGLGPVLAGLGLMITMMAPLAGVVAAVVSPLGLLAVGVAAVGTAIYANWDYLRTEFPAITGAIEGGAALVQAVFENLVAAQKPAIDGALEHFRLLGKTLDALLSRDFSGALENNKAMFLNFHSTLMSVFDALLGDLDQKGIAMASSLVAGFGNAWNSGIASVKQFGADVVAWVVNIYVQALEAAKNIGRNIVDGIKQGLQEKWDSLKSYVSGLADNLPAIMRKGLQIQSPSRVFSTIGGFVVDGLILGLDRGAGALGDAVSRMGNLVTLDAGGFGAGGLDDALADVGQTADGVFSRMGRWLADMSTGATTLKDTLRGVLDGWAGSLRQSGMAGIGSFLTGAVGPSLGGIASGFLGGLMGFADGGSFKVGGAGGIDSKVAAFRVSPNETVNITKPGQSFAGQAGGVVRVIIEESAAFAAIVQQEASNAAVEVVKAGLTANNRALTEAQRRAK